MTHFNIRTLKSNGRQGSKLHKPLLCQTSTQKRLPANAEINQCPDFVQALS